MLVLTIACSCICMNALREDGTFVFARGPGNSKREGCSWGNKFGLQVFDLSVDKICALLENSDTRNGTQTSHIIDSIDYVTY